MRPSSLYVFWPCLSLGFVILCCIFWVTRRFAGDADDSHDRALTTVPRSPVARARPRWGKPLYFVLCAPFVLQSPLAIVWAPPRLAAQKEPHVIVEWSWLAIGPLLISGFVMSRIVTIACAPRD